MVYYGLHFKYKKKCQVSSITFFLQNLIVQQFQGFYMQYKVLIKVVMQVKLIAVAYTPCVHIVTSFLCAEFVNNNRCVSVRLLSEEVKSIKF